MYALLSRCISLAHNRNQLFQQQSFIHKIRGIYNLLIVAPCLFTVQIKSHDRISPFFIFSIGKGARGCYDRRLYLRKPKRRIPRTHPIKIHGSGEAESCALENCPDFLREGAGVGVLVSLTAAWAVSCTDAFSGAFSTWLFF